MKYALIITAIAAAIEIGSFVGAGRGSDPSSVPSAPRNTVPLGDGDRSPIGESSSTASVPRKSHKIKAYVTAYSVTETCVAYTKDYCITASGDLPVEHQTVACPRALRLGTHVEIQGEEYICQDRTNIRYDGRFDIFMLDFGEAQSHGKTYEEITIFE